MCLGGVKLLCVCSGSFGRRQDEAVSSTSSTAATTTSSTSTTTITSPTGHRSVSRYTHTYTNTVCVVPY